ncbi:hypothetical protein B0H13DRAFT_2266662 [Mycena leptocephala]|nr:hypothetical protein B0H13DRAFT_2266662 [Mycena leptocephala]
MSCLKMSEDLDYFQVFYVSKYFQIYRWKARSKAIKTAIARYNEAAEAMTPPKPTLDWEEVIEYAFLADFDLLREGREDIWVELWAQPAGRATMDQHFKLLHADEEIQRLNVEIRRFVTYMRDEEAFLIRDEGRLGEEGRPGIAHQVRLVRMERARFTDLHNARLLKLSKVPAFTGDILPGISISRERHTLVARERDVEMYVPSPPPGPDAVGVPPPEEEEEEDIPSDDDEDGTLADVFLNIIRISGDRSSEAEDRVIEHEQERFENHDVFQPERFLDDTNNLKSGYETTCPGIPFAERALWSHIAMMLWIFNIRKSDEPDPKTGLSFKYDDSDLAFTGEARSEIARRLYF